MNALVVYDSSFGNTEILAKAIGDAIGGGARVLRTSEVGPSDWQGLDLLVVGSPTQGGRPFPSIAKLLTELSPGNLRETSVAAFDTRFAANESGLGLRVLMRMVGYAAPRIAKMLQANGGQLVVAPEGFIVQGKEGPLKRGELERAATWATGIGKVAKLSVHAEA